jgi:tetratricopeptide (TPR) repeat protein
MRATMIVIVLVVFISVSHSVAVAQAPYSVLRGNVRSSSTGALPANVRIQLQKSGMTIQEEYLRESGFEFSNLERGRYTLIVQAPGFQTAVEDVDVPSSWPVIDLRPQRKASQPAEGVPVWQLKIPEAARRQFEAAKGKLERNDCANALDHLKKAIHTYADYGDAHNAMGQCYAQMSQFEAAEQEIKLALEQPHKPGLHLLLAKIYAREGHQGLLEHQLALYAEESPKRHE